MIRSKLQYIYSLHAHSKLETCKNEHPSGGGGLSNGSNGNRFAPLQNDGRARSGAVSGNGGHGGKHISFPASTMSSRAIAVILKRI